MGCCVKCGRMLRPGEGRRPITTSLWQRNGLVCNSCYRDDKSGIKAFFTLFIGLLVGAVSAGSLCAVLSPLADSLGFGTMRGIVVGLAIVALIAWFIIHRREARTGMVGCLVRMLMATVEFVLFWLAIGLLLATFINGGDLLKSMWGLEEGRSTEVGKVVED